MAPSRSKSSPNLPVLDEVLPRECKKGSAKISGTPIKQKFSMPFLMRKAVCSREQLPGEIEGQGGGPQPKPRKGPVQDCEDTETRATTLMETRGNGVPRRAPLPLRWK